MSFSATIPFSRSPEHLVRTFFHTPYTAQARFQSLANQTILTKCRDKNFRLQFFFARNQLWAWNLAKFLLGTEKKIWPSKALEKSEKTRIKINLSHYNCFLEKFQSFAKLKINHCCQNLIIFGHLSVKTIFGINGHFGKNYLSLVTPAYHFHLKQFTKK